MSIDKGDKERDIKRERERETNKKLDGERELCVCGI